MKAIVIYKSKYGASKAYANEIAKVLECDIKNYKDTDISELEKSYDTIIYGGGLYAEIIAGVTLITKNLEKLKNKNLIVFTTGLTPVDYRDYYDKLVIGKNFKGDARDKIKIFNFPGKMIIDELSIPHKIAIKGLKKIMSEKENPTEAEKLLLELCDKSGDFTDMNAVDTLTKYVKNLNL